MSDQHIIEHPNHKHNSNPQATIQKVHNSNPQATSIDVEFPRRKNIKKLVAGEKIVSDITGLWESRHKWLHPWLASKQARWCVRRYNMSIFTSSHDAIKDGRSREVVYDYRIWIRLWTWETSWDQDCPNLCSSLGAFWLNCGDTGLVGSFDDLWSSPNLSISTIAATLERCPFMVLITSSGRANRLQHGNVFEHFARACFRGHDVAYRWGTNGLAKLGIGRATTTISLRIALMNFSSSACRERRRNQHNILSRLKSQTAISWSNAHKRFGHFTNKRWEKVLPS